MKRSSCFSENRRVGPTLGASLIKFEVAMTGAEAPGENGDVNVVEDKSIPVLNFEIIFSKHYNLAKRFQIYWF